MLRSLVTGSLHNRFLVVLLAAALLGGGVLSALRSPLDVFPEFAPPLVEAPGMSSEAVEQLVTIPLESALNGLPQMTTLRSKSVQGLSSVQMLFEPGSDVFRARQMVSERVAVQATRLPQLARAPHIMPPLSSTSRVLKLGLTPKKGRVPPLDQTDVSVAMKWIIEPRLRAVAGVANVSTYGLHDRQYQILVKPADLRDHGLTLDQVRQVTKQAVVYGSAGFHDTPNQRLAIQHQTRVERFEDLGRTVIAHRKGEPILLGQVASLTTGNPPHIGEGIVNDEPGLLVVVEKFPWANTLEVTRDVDAAVEAVKPSVPGVEIATRIFRPASFIELALANLRVAVLIGCGLVAAIVVAFLWEWRTAAISLTAIPLSLLGAVFVLERLGGALNTMVLAGLAIAVGEVVDDAIIDVENIVRRLRQEPPGKSAFQVILDASIEVRSAIVFASAVVVFVCLPIFFLGGVAGAFFRPLAVAYILAVAVSLVIALTLTPALSMMLLPGHIGSEHGSPVARLARGIYRRVLTPALYFPKLTIIGLGLVLVATVAAVPLLREEYLPQFQETTS
jgi:Cu/Ag efflux pump CusA